MSTNSTPGLPSQLEALERLWRSAHRYGILFLADLYGAGIANAVKALLDEIDKLGPDSFPFQTDRTGAAWPEDEASGSQGEGQPS